MKYAYNSLVYTSQMWKHHASNLLYIYDGTRIALLGRMPLYSYRTNLSIRIINCDICKNIDLNRICEDIC